MAMEQGQSIPTGLSLSIPSAPSKSTQPRVYKTPSLRVRAARKVVEGNTSKPFRRSHIKRILRSFRPNTDVKIEASPFGVAASVLYASEDSVSGDCLVPTTVVSGIPEPDDPSIVCQDSEFEARVVGMHVPNFDCWGPFGDNELFMYSQDTANMTEPIVHYDYKSDEYCGSSAANVYVPIPCSKSFVTGSEGGAKVKTSINVRFCVLELDNPGRMAKEAIDGIGNASQLVRGVSAVQAVGPVLKLVSELSKSALHAYAKPDKVITVDADFALADRAKLATKVLRAGEYLRYGYYFFLSEPIEGQLYASVRTVKNVRLMFKREKHHHVRGGWPFAGPVEAKKYFPLADISYIVLRVTEPMGSRKSSALGDAEAYREAMKRNDLNAWPLQQ